MADFILIHGSWFGAWCWDRVAGILRESGHRVVAIDLPGHGADRTPLAAIHFPDYVDAVNREIGRFGIRPILVGHSMGAMVATHTVDQVPECVIASVSVAGLQIPSGTSMLDALAGADPGYLETIVWSHDRTTALISPEGAASYLHQRCQDAAATVANRLTPEPTAPYISPLTHRADVYQRVPHYYIRCTEDKALLPSLQTEMCRQSRPAGVFEIATDHCPFFSAPGELSDILGQIAARAELNRPAPRETE